MNVHDWTLVTLWIADAVLLVAILLLLMSAQLFHKARQAVASAQALVVRLRVSVDAAGEASSVKHGDP